ncbi:hypothetical protein ACFLT7_07215 [candidate division KSB1 bacterium]
MSQTRLIEAKLKNKTPNWSQTQNSSGRWVGCGPTAWAIVLGYWKQYKGKNKLLTGLNMPHSQSGSSDADLHKHINQLAKDTETSEANYQGVKFGRTLPRNMDKAKKFIQRNNKYTCSIERDLGPEFSKFRKVKTSLLNDRPVIILINDLPQIFSTLHYPVIEKAELKQEKRFRHSKWRDRRVRYYVNMGNGKREWICVREVGVNKSKHTGSFSMFHLKIN